MTETTAQPLTRDDVRAIVSEEIGKVGHLLGQSALNSNEPSLEIAEGDDKVRKDQAHKVVAGVLADQFDEPLPQPYNRGGLLGDRPLADGFGDICDKVGVTHNSSPSVDDAGAHSVGDGPGAGDASAFPATWVTEGKLAKRLHNSVVRKSEALGRVEKAERKLRDAREDLAHAENEQREASAAYDAFIAGGAA